MKKAIVKKKKRSGTILYIPDGIGETKSYRVPQWFGIAAGFVLVFLLVTVLSGASILMHYRSSLARARHSISRLEAESIQNLEIIARLQNSKEAKQTENQPKPSEIKSTFTQAAAASAVIGYQHFKPTQAPVNGKIVRPFSLKSNTPEEKKNVYNLGIDYEVPKGHTISASANGIVVFSGPRPGIGNVIVINHGKVFSTAYFHSTKLLVAQGERVKKGQPIAKAEGITSTYKLHYQVLMNGKPVNPQRFISVKK